MWTAGTFLAGMMLALVAPAHSAATLHFIQDDPSTALAEAKKRGVPVFVEAWAPW
jgi:hypothetical protein